MRAKNLLCALFNYLHYGLKLLSIRNLRDFQFQVRISEMECSEFAHMQKEVAKELRGVPTEQTQHNHLNVHANTLHKTASEGSGFTVGEVISQCSLYVIACVYKTQIKMFELNTLI